MTSVKNTSVLCVMLTLTICTGLEFNLDLRLTPCGVLQCEQSLSSASAEANLAGVAPPVSISGLTIFRRSPNGSPGDLVAALTLQQPSIVTRVSDGIKVDGLLTAERASLRLEMDKQVDCLAEYTCQLNSVDAQGRESITTSHLVQPGGPPANDVSSSVELRLLSLAQKLDNFSRVIENGLTAMQEEMQADFGHLEADINSSMAESFSAVSNLITRSCGQQSTTTTALPGLQCIKGMTPVAAQDLYPYPLVEPSTSASDLDVPFLCDSTTDGGGWIIIQRRTNGVVDFNRGWVDYRDGFGALDTDFWLGNKHIHALTSSATYELRVELQYSTTSAFAHYATFSVEDEQNNYTLRLGRYDGTAGDSLTSHNGKPWSTHDRDNDNDAGNCAASRFGGWWFDHCGRSGLNGKWGAGSSRGLLWYDFSGYPSATFSEMKIRRV